MSRPCLVAMLLFTAMCCSHGRDRVSDERIGQKLREHDDGIDDMPRRVREEVLDNRRGPAWLAKLPQRLQRGDTGNRPFAVQDARVVQGSRKEPVPQTPLRAKHSEGDPQTSSNIEPSNAVLDPNSVSLMRPRAADPSFPRTDRELVRYEQEEQWRRRAREAWNSMLENARVGILSKGKLIVEPRLAGSASSIMSAALNGDVELLKSALDEAGASIGVTNSVGETPLMLAAISGNPNGMAVLLARGADLNTRDMHGWTALMKAVALGDNAAVNFLLSAGADTEVKNIANQTACIIAGKWGRTATERLLIGAGACPAPVAPDSEANQKALKHARGTQEGDRAEDPQMLKASKAKRIIRRQDTDSARWKMEADVRLEWQLEKEREAQEWIEELALNHERHLTQYRIIKDLEHKLLEAERRLERAEQMLDVCQADLSEETRKLLEDYHRRLQDACASTESSSSPSSSSAPSSSSMSGCDSCEVEFYTDDSAQGAGSSGVQGGLVIHDGGGKASKQEVPSRCLRAEGQRLVGGSGAASASAPEHDDGVPASCASSSHARHRKERSFRPTSSPDPHSVPAGSDGELVWNEDFEEPLDVDAAEHAEAAPRDLRLRAAGEDAVNDRLSSDDVVMLRLRGDEILSGAIPVDDDGSFAPERESVDDELLRLRSKGLRGGDLGLRGSAEEATDMEMQGEEGAVRLRGAVLRIFDEVQRVGADVAQGR